MLSLQKQNETFSFITYATYLLWWKMACLYQIWLQIADNMGNIPILEVPMLNWVMWDFC